MGADNTTPRIEPTRQAIAAAANDAGLQQCRFKLAKFSSVQMHEAGMELALLVHLQVASGPSEVSPFGHGNDETVAVSVLLRIAAELVSASGDLFVDGRHYAAAALLRQMVEIEYLAWAFETRSGDGERWLRSSERERQEFFKPAKLREAAKGQFRSKDYGYHCELGGHPVPNSYRLLLGDTAIAQLLLSDLLGHIERIWGHLFRWARRSDNGAPILSRSSALSKQFLDWRALDPLVDLPPPP